MQDSKPALASEAIPFTWEYVPCFHVHKINDCLGYPVLIGVFHMQQCITQQEAPDLL